MPRRGGKHFVLLSKATGAMEELKREVARELGIHNFETLTPREVGTIGGEIVRRLALVGEYVVLKRYERGLRPLLPRIAQPDEISSVTGDNLADRVATARPEDVLLT